METFKTITVVKYWVSYNTFSSCNFIAVRVVFCKAAIFNEEALNPLLLFNPG